MGIYRIIIGFWLFFPRCSDCENAASVLAVEALLSKGRRFPDAAKWLKWVVAFQNCYFSEYAWAAGRLDPGDLSKCPRVRSWPRCLSLVGWGTSCCSCRALDPTPGTLQSSQLCLPTWPCSFASGLGETKGDRMCWSNAELEPQGQAWAVYPRTGAQKHPHAGQLCSEHNSNPVICGETHS